MAFKAVFCVFYCKQTGRFLFEFRGIDVNYPNTYGLFGGGIDKGEKPKEAMRRELREEIGMSINHFACKVEAGKVRFYGVLVTNEFTPKLSEESTAYVWSKSLPKPTHPKLLRFMTEFKRVQSMLINFGDNHQ